MIYKGINKGLRVYGKFCFQFISFLESLFVPIFHIGSAIPCKAHDVFGLVKKLTHFQLEIFFF